MKSIIKEILFVDDDPVVLKIYEILIKRLETSIHYSSFMNPIDALDYLKRFDDGVLIFLDINMPQMNAWQFLDDIRSHDKSFVTFLVTSSCSQWDINASSNFPCVVDIIEKPFTKELLLDIVNRFEIECKNTIF